MDVTTTDTIAAIATPPGNGGVGIIRLSGTQALAIAEQLLNHPISQPRQAYYRQFMDHDGSVIDNGMAIYFAAPASYTGEDILELQGHGGSVVLEMLLERVLQLGARLAQPGEFTQRAFLNNKMDLAQAEAVADLISSSTAQAVRSAQNSMQGVFSAQINQLLTELTRLRVYVEAAIDFSDEDIDFLSSAGIEAQLQQVLLTLEKIQASAQQGRLLHDGMTVVLAGKPNAGKSSLLNTLAGYEAAIVHEMAGTTRDVLKEKIHINGMPLHIIDTAGLRTSENAVEQEGIRRAQLEIEKADQVLLLIDIQDQAPSNLPPTLPQRSLTKVFNKIDTVNEQPRIIEHQAETHIYLSVKTGQGIDLLRQHLKRCAGFSENSEQVFIARKRHIIALDAAQQAVISALELLQSQQAPELIAEDLRQAQNSLATITGAFSSDDLLGEIFSSFCIGK